MHAGCNACCPLVSHVDYALHAVLRFEKRRDKQTGCQTVLLRLPLDGASIINELSGIIVATSSTGKMLPLMLSEKGSLSNNRECQSLHNLHDVTN